MESSDDICGPNYNIDNIENSQSGRGSKLFQSENQPKNRNDKKDRNNRNDRSDENDEKRGTIIGVF